MVPAASVLELDTPCLIVDLDVFEANVRTAMNRLRGVNVRPHMKTSKSPAVAKLLLNAGAVGICVAKISEAETMLEGGIRDILVTSEIAGRHKAQRFASLVNRFPEAQFTVVVDDYPAASELAGALSRPIRTLIDVNVGQNRTGVLPEDARELAARLQALPRLRLVGLQGYEGHLQVVLDARERAESCARAMERLALAADAVRSDGHSVEVVTAGGTGTAEFCMQHPYVTEVQPGSFIFMDAEYCAAADVPYAPALTARATVISTPARNRVVIDAGLKTLSNDAGNALVIAPTGWTYENAGDEHGILETASTTTEPLEVGDTVTLIPSHSDTTVNLHDVLYTSRDGHLLGTWPVAARGKVQ